MQISDDEGARAPAGPNDSGPAVTAEVVSPRGSEGGASSSLAASPSNSPALEVLGSLAQQPCHPPAEQSGFQLACFSSHLGHRVQASLLSVQFSTAWFTCWCSVGSGTSAIAGTNQAHLIIIMIVILVIIIIVIIMIVNTCNNYKL